MVYKNGEIHIKEGTYFGNLKVLSILYDGRFLILSNFHCKKKTFNFSRRYRVTSLNWVMVKSPLIKSVSEVSNLVKLKMMIKRNKIKPMRLHQVRRRFVNHGVIDYRHQITESLVYSRRSHNLWSPLSRNVYFPLLRS